MKTKLVLFDIDQTILNSGGAGEKALAMAVRERFGPGQGLEGIEIAGRTDIGIAHQLFARHRIEATSGEVDRFVGSYLAHLRTTLAENKGRLMPGFPEILERLAAMPFVALGLLTGNVRPGAELKLSRYGMWHYFAFGAFSDDSHDRNLLGEFARRRAAEIYGADFLARDTFVIGDTPHDIACAKAFGARSVGVATGNFTREQLEACHPEFVFGDLGEPDGVLKALGFSAAG